MNSVTRLAVALTAVSAMCLLTSALRAAPSTAPTEGPRASLPGFGISIQAPAGWVRVEELSYSQLARFVKITGDRATGVLEVNAAPAQAKSVADVAAGIATERHGRIINDPALRGPKGSLLVQLAPTEQFSACRAAVLPAGAKMLVILCGATDATSANSAIKAAMDGITLTDPKPAVDDLTLRKPPIRLFDSRVLIALPEPFRPDAVKDPTKEMFWGVHDWPSGRDEVSLIGQLVPNPNHAPLDQVTADLGKDLRTKLKLAMPITFERVSDRPEVYVSSTLTSGPNESQRIIDVSTEDGQVATLIFRTTAPTAEARDAYMNAVRAISQSARLLP